MEMPDYLGDRLAIALAHCLTPNEDGVGGPELAVHIQPGMEWGFEVDLAGEFVYAASTISLLTTLSRRIESLIAEHSPTHIFVHSGVARLGERLIMIPGGSHAGKSTAVAALVKAGATYWSDEFAPVDAHGLVVPFPRPLNRRTGAGTERLAMVVPVDSSARPVDLVIFTGYEPEASYQPRAVSRGEALLRLLEHTVPARNRPAEAMESLGLVVRTARVETGTRGEAEEFVQALLAKV